MESSRIHKFLPEGKFAWSLIVIGIAALAGAIFFSYPSVLVGLGIKGGAYAAGAGMVAFIFGIPAYLIAVVIFSVGQISARLRSAFNAVCLCMTIAALVLTLAIDAYGVNKRRAYAKQPVMLVEPNQTYVLPEGCALTNRCNDLVYFSCTDDRDGMFGYFVQADGRRQDKRYSVVAKCGERACQKAENCGTCPPDAWTCKLPRLP